MSRKGKPMSYMFPKKGKRAARHSTQWVEDRLWEAYSEHVRRSAADDLGYVRCFTCGARVHWKACDAGHYISRNRKAVKFDDRNVKPQCHNCNRILHGNGGPFARNIDLVHGEGTAAMLEQLGSVRGTKLGREWLEQELAKYRKLNSNLRKTHRFAVL